MPTEYIRYAEDLTGTNPDNLVSGEPHALSARPVRVVVTNHGPFFTESVAVYDGVSQLPLIKGTDYTFPTISQELSLRSGKEVADAILITNTSVASSVLVTYQCVGGLFQNNVSNVVGMFEDFLNDNRLIDWVEGVYGKPAEYPPGPHPHWLADIFGFEPLVFQLERIKQAIELGNSAFFEEFAQWLMRNIATEQEIDMGLPLKKFMSLERHIYALDKFNYNGIWITPKVTVIGNGSSRWFEVKANNVPDNITYYWTIEHITTTIDDFPILSGLVHLVNGLGTFRVQSTRTIEEEDNETFRVALRKNGPMGFIMAQTGILTLRRHANLNQDTILDAYINCCLPRPGKRLTAKTNSIWRSLKNAA